MDRGNACFSVSGQWWDERELAFGGEINRLVREFTFPKDRPFVFNSVGEHTLKVSINDIHDDRIVPVDALMKHMLDRNNFPFVYLLRVREYPSLYAVAVLGFEIVPCYDAFIASKRGLDYCFEHPMSEEQLALVRKYQDEVAAEKVG